LQCFILGALNFKLTFQFLPPLISKNCHNYQGFVIGAENFCGIIIVVFVIVPSTVAVVVVLPVLDGRLSAGFFLLRANISLVLLSLCPSPNF